MAKFKAKQQRFVEEYMIDLNATQAAIRAGYSPKTAGSIGEENLRKPEIDKAISILRAEQSKRTGVTADRVIREMAKIGFANITNVVDFDDATVRQGTREDDTAAIQSVKVKRIPTDDGEIIEREIKLYDKTKALVELGKHVGVFDSKSNVNIFVPIVFNDNLTDDAE